MTDLQQSIEQQVNIFMQNVSDLVRQAAIEALGEAVIGAGPRTGKQQPRRNKSSTRKGKAKGRARKPAAPRDPAELAALTERLYKAIASQPGEKMEVLAQAVGCPASDLRVSIGHLVDKGRVKKAGQRRSTVYFPMGSDRP